MGLIHSWSFSRLSTFEKCPARLKFQVLDKIPEPPNPYAERGIQLHKEAEKYIKAKLDTLPSDFEPFRKKMDFLRSRFKTGDVKIEDEWGFNNRWQPCEWKIAWLRMKLDAFVRLDLDRAVVVDHKTGKKTGNEIKHADQATLYAAGCFVSFPELKEVTTEFNYIDQKDDMVLKFTPTKIAKAIVSFEKRGNKLINATSFPAKPNIFNCPYCPYGNNGTKDCKDSV